MRLSPSLLLLTLLACDGISYGEADDWRRDSAVMLVRPPYYRAGCSAVATGPHEITTVQHCAAPEWEYLTLAAWLAGDSPGRAELVECHTIGTVHGYTDGWCTYRTRDELPHWAPRIGRRCRGDVAIVHSATHYAFAVHYTETLPTRADSAWLRYRDPTGPGSSGAPVWCGSDLVGVVALTGWAVTWW